MATAIFNQFYPDIFSPLKDQSPRPGILPQKGSSLERACWLYGVIGNAVFVLPFVALLFVLTPDAGMTAVMHGYFAGIVAYTIWAFNRIWARASGHDENPRLVLGARLYIVLGGTQLAIYSMYVISYYAAPVL